MNFVGIDPGQSGGVVFLNDDGEIIGSDVMQGPLWFISVMKPLTETIELQTMIFLEKCQPMPKNGSVSMFHYGTHFGELMGMLYALSLPFELVPPQSWTKTMHAGANKKDPPKVRSLASVQRLFPKANLLATSRSRKPHEGLIDALLIAEYGRRKWMRK